MEPSRRPLIEIEHVFVTYPGTERHILNDFSLTLYEGEHAVIRGGNGAGKSTLLRLLRGEQWPDQIDHRRAGRVLWHGPEGMDSSPLTGRKVTSLVSAMQQERVVHQEWRVDGERLVLGGFSDAIYIAQQPTSEMCETAYQLVRLLGGVHLLKKPVTAMSQGQLRLMLVARSLVRKPGVLLLDEVTDGLDARARNTLLDALERASELSTLVMTTHRPETLPSWIGRQIVLENGKAVDGPMLETAVEPEREPAPVASAPELKGIRGCSARIAIKDASVFIDRVPVLYDINWTINPGENWAVLGGNGAGKSTMLNATAGTFFVDSGKVIIDGSDVTNLPEHKRAAFIGRVFQDPMMGTAPSMWIEENLALAARRGQRRGLSWGVTKEEKEQYRELLGGLGLGLESRLTTKVSTLSGGQRQALTLLMATLKRPKLLLLDEHTAALDPKTAAKVMELTDRIVRDGQLTTLMITHNMRDAIQYGNRLIMLHDGHVILDIAGEEKKKLTVPDLLEQFTKASGDEFANDRAILS